MQEKIYCKKLKTPWGEMLLGVYGDSLCMADWLYRKQRTQLDDRIKKQLQSELVYEHHPLHIEVEKQLNAYAAKKLKKFELPLLLCGTDFQKSVWHNLLAIPYGTTMSYMALAQKMHNVLAIRAIATANGANAISIIVPCHRIIGTQGELVGYAGGIAVKKKLLQLEGNSMQREMF